MSMPFQSRISLGSHSINSKWGTESVLKPLYFKVLLSASDNSCLVTSVARFTFLTSANHSGIPF